MAEINEYLKARKRERLRADEIYPDELMNIEMADGERPPDEGLDKGYTEVFADTGLWMPEKRLRNGCYETPGLLCDFILALTDGLGGGRLLDPGCGTGIFLLRAWERRHQLYRSSGGILHGVERDDFAAEIADFRLRLLSGKNNAAGFRVDTANFLKAEISTMGTFDVIVGNPPYVRQEHLCPVESVETMAALSHQYADYLAAWPEQKMLFSTKTDLYVRFILQSCLLLAPGGHLTFVISNSWLNADFGQALRQFISHHFYVRYLVESACERWFRDAAVNSVILALKKKRITGIHSMTPDPVRLIRLLKPLEEWMPDPCRADYWQQLDQRINHLERDAAVVCRVMPSEQLCGKDNIHRWAFILRASTTLRDWTENPKLWRRLDSLGKVRYALKTGINRFFYLSRHEAEAWRIEPEFLFPVVRSARQVKSYSLSEEDCDTVLFFCGESPESLDAEGKSGALAYIRWGEAQTAPPRQKRLQAVPWPQVTSVRSNHPWYAVKLLPPPDLLCNRFMDRRFFFPLCHGNLIEDQTFYGVTLNNRLQTPPELIAGLLNSTLSCLLLELNARTNLGEGVLQYARGDMAAFPALDPELYQPGEQRAIIEAFRAMAGRRIITSPESELRQPDRILLDEAVLTPVIERFYPGSDMFSLREQWVSDLLERIDARHTMARRKSEKL